jgi:hypothetical protein
MSVTAPKPSDRSYKRSWRNLLINKRYQLRFTLFMVGLSSLLMGGLGIWVMKVANETTEVSKASVRGEACPKVPSLGSGAPTGDDEDAAPSMKQGEAPGSPAGGSPSPSPSPSPPGAAAPSDPAPAPVPAAPAAGPAGSAKPEGSPAAAPAGGATDKAHPAGTPGSAPAADGEPRHATVQIDESSMTLSQTLPPDLADRFVAHWTCELRQVATFDRLERGRLRILWAMIVTGMLLVIGLAVYGIKMTHRVAGPLFKVSLYLTKMREGRFDKVYNLRKGDQLVEFYDHFKLAHGGVVAMQQDDIDRIAAVIAAAEAAGTGAHPAVAELREMLARKEKSLE